MLVNVSGADYRPNKKKLLLSNNFGSVEVSVLPIKESKKLYSRLFCDDCGGVENHVISSDITKRNSTHFACIECSKEQVVFLNEITAVTLLD